MKMVLILASLFFTTNIFAKDIFQIQQSKILKKLDCSAGALLFNLNDSNKNTVNISLFGMNREYELAEAPQYIIEADTAVLPLSSRIEKNFTQIVLKVKEPAAIYKDELYYIHLNGNLTSKPGEVPHVKGVVRKIMITWPWSLGNYPIESKDGSITCAIEFNFEKN